MLGAPSQLAVLDLGVPLLEEKAWEGRLPKLSALSTPREPYCSMVVAVTLTGSPTVSSQSEFCHHVTEAGLHRRYAVLRFEHTVSIPQCLCSHFVISCSLWR